MPTGDNPTATAAAARDTTAAPLPLFYRKPQPLRVDKHRGLKLRAGGDYSFTKAANAIPLAGAEFAVAHRFYPIVFTQTDPALPVIIVGLNREHNAYVDDKGTWEPGHYVPAYVRRYPFIFYENTDNDQYVLCLDEDSALLGDDGEALFENDEPSDVAKRALDFCAAFEQQHRATKDFIAALEERGLLIAKRADVSLKTGATAALDGFRMIDEEGFGRISDDVVLEWRRRGWLPLVYAHLWSQQCWSDLIDRAAATGNA